MFITLRKNVVLMNALYGAAFDREGLKLPLKVPEVEVI